MEQNIGADLSYKLQINTSGRWKDMLYFQTSQREGVMAGVAAIAREVGNSITWRVVNLHDDRRDWLSRETTSEGWQPVTEREPAPLEDVLISVLVGNDEAPVVFMGYRKAFGTVNFFISGTCDHVIQGAYAWKGIDEPAPASMIVA